jgi:superfamily II DNA or RNA helicase
MNYQEFLKQKKHSTIKNGLSFLHDNKFLFDYQRHVCQYAIEKGRAAVFLDTGLGKTLIELVLADNFVRQTNKPVLIITPLAVAFQFVNEAAKFGIYDVKYSKDGTIYSKIIICNYERLDKFNPNDFDCVILDESSILKNFDGAIKAQVTAFLKKVKYRFLFTATPSPNDYIELGTSSEALGYMGYMDMLKKYFSNNENNVVKAQNIGTKWVLKPHAIDSFFEWVSTWSISVRKPSDIGYTDERHVLPELIVNHNKLFNEKNLCIDNQFQLFNAPSSRLTEVREENKATVEIRCQKAAELAKETCVYWCNTNQENDLLSDYDKSAKEITGSMSLDEKEDILMNFANGNIKRLITKPKITSFGLNWQHCNHTVYFPTFSYEQYYQAIRRFWRFGQKLPVVVDLVYSDGQEKVINSLIEKAKKADELYQKLNSKINGEYKNTIEVYEKKPTIPNFLKGN